MFPAVFPKQIIHLPFRQIFLRHQMFVVSFVQRVGVGFFAPSPVFCRPKNITKGAINTSLVIPLNLWRPRSQGPRRGWRWVKNIYYFILLNHIHHLQKQLTLHIIKSTNSTISDSLSLVLLLNGRLDFNRERMEFQLLLLFSFVPGSVFHEDKVSSLSKFERVLRTKAFISVKAQLITITSNWTFETENYVQLRSSWIIQSHWHNEQKRRFTETWTTILRLQKLLAFTRKQVENFCLISLLCWSNGRARLKHWPLTSKEKKTYFSWYDWKFTLL